MITFFLGLFLLIVLWFAMLLLKTYKQTPKKELKRQARAGDKLADSLYRVVGFGKVLDITLWFIIGLSASWLFTLLASHSSFIVAIIIISLLIWFGFGWMPSSYSSFTGRKIASYSAKPLHFIINLLYPVLSKVEQIILKHSPITVHTGLYEKQDLVNLLQNQQNQLDNRISKEDIKIAKNALTFGEKKVSDVMTPRRVMKTVNANESVGPVLMEELHKCGHSRFPVYKDKKDNFVGILHMKNVLKARAGGKVSNLADFSVYFVHDESSISEVLQAFIKTHYHMFLVVNSFEEVVGLITMEDVLEQILGKPILDEFDQYDSMRAVASKLAKKDHQENKEAIKTSPKSTEVIE